MPSHDVLQESNRGFHLWRHSGVSAGTGQSCDWSLLVLHYIIMVCTLALVLVQDSPVTGLFLFYVALLHVFVGDCAALVQRYYNIIVITKATIVFNSHLYFLEQCNNLSPCWLCDKLLVVFLLIKIVCGTYALAIEVTYDCGLNLATVYIVKYRTCEADFALSSQPLLQSTK
jgi:hypothetical protein